LTQSDPTDDALATIASILDYPEAPTLHRGPEPEIVKVKVEDKSLAPVPADADGYTKIGPGPIAAIRFKWTARRADDGEYYVGETIGDQSVPIVTGPMTKEAAIRFVDDRESEARLRFEQLRSEMSGRAVVADMVREDGGEL